MDTSAGDHVRENTSLVASPVLVDVPANRPVVNSLVSLPASPTSSLLSELQTPRQVHMAMNCTDTVGAIVSDTSEGVQVVGLSCDQDQGQARDSDNPAAQAISVQPEEGSPSISRLEKNLQDRTRKCEDESDSVEDQEETAHLCLVNDSCKSDFSQEALCENLGSGCQNPLVKDNEFNLNSNGQHSGADPENTSEKKVAVNGDIVDSGKANVQNGLVCLKTNLESTPSCETATVNLISGNLLRTVQHNSKSLEQDTLTESHDRSDGSDSGLGSESAEALSSNSADELCSGAASDSETYFIENHLDKNRGAVEGDEIHIGQSFSSATKTFEPNTVNPEVKKPADESVQNHVCEDLTIFNQSFHQENFARICAQQSNTESLNQPIFSESLIKDKQLNICPSHSLRSEVQSEVHIKDHNNCLGNLGEQLPIFESQQPLDKIFVSEPPHPSSAIGRCGGNLSKSDCPDSIVDCGMLMCSNENVALTNYSKPVECNAENLHSLPEKIQLSLEAVQECSNNIVDHRKVDNSVSILGSEKLSKTCEKLPHMTNAAVNFQSDSDVFPYDKYDLRPSDKNAIDQTDISGTCIRQPIDLAMPSECGLTEDSIPTFDDLRTPPGETESKISLEEDDDAPLQTPTVTLAPILSEFGSTAEEIDIKELEVSSNMVCQGVDTVDIGFSNANQKTESGTLQSSSMNSSEAMAGPSSCSPELSESSSQIDRRRSTLKRAASSSCGGGTHPKRKRSIAFDSVSVYYFPRTQGFTCVPSQGGSTLGMAQEHTHMHQFTIVEHAMEQRRAHRNMLMQLRRSTDLTRHDDGANCSTSNNAGGGDETSDDSDSEEEQSEISEEEMDMDGYYFLQPVPTRQRRALLRAAGVRKIDSVEKDDCRDIRSSREFCGCGCKNFCDPETCSCSQAGIKCQVDRLNFPCGCTREGCGNTSGRIEFNPMRVRTHFIHTLMRLELEKKQQKEEEEMRRQQLWTNQITSSGTDMPDGSSSSSTEVESCADVTSFGNIPSSESAAQSDDQYFLGGPQGFNQQHLPQQEQPRRVPMFVLNQNSFSYSQSGNNYNAAQGASYSPAGSFNYSNSQSSQDVNYQPPQPQQQQFNYQSYQSTTLPSISNITTNYRSNIYRDQCPGRPAGDQNFVNVNGSSCPEQQLGLYVNEACEDSVSSAESSHMGQFTALNSVCTLSNQLEPYSNLLGGRCQYVTSPAEGGERTAEVVETLADGDGSHSSDGTTTEATGLTSPPDDCDENFGEIIKKSIVETVSA